MSLDELKSILKLSQIDFSKNVSTKSGRYFMICCPRATYHKGGVDEHPSFSISTKVPYWCKCFGCGFSGPIRKLLIEKKLAGVPVEEALSILDSDLGWTPDVQEEYDIEKDPPDLDHVKKMLPVWKMSKHPYMKERGFDQTTLSVWEFGFDSKYGTIMMPVRDRSFEIVGAVGRYVKNKGFYNLRNFVKSEHLFGENHATKNTRLLVVEGIFDAPKVWQFLFNNSMLDEFSVVSTMGCEPSKVQVDRMLDITDNIICAYDFDSAGIKGTKLLTKLVGNRAKVDRLKYRFSPDFESVVQKEIRAGNVTKVDPDVLVDRFGGWCEAIFRNPIPSLA